MSIVGFVALSFVLGPSHLFAEAWNCAGHMMTVQIALNRSETKVLNWLAPAFHYAMNIHPHLSTWYELGCWPDDKKKYSVMYNRYYNGWHYHDSCYHPNENNNTATCPPVDDGVLNLALPASIEGVTTFKPQDIDFAFWLGYLVHLVGDAHQPLHLCTLFDNEFPVGDLGGNFFSIMYDGYKTNLHSFHDSIAELTNYSFPKRPVKLFPDTEAAFLDMTWGIQQKYPVSEEQLDDLNLSDWMAEALVLCGTVSYKNQTPWENVTQEYTMKVREMLESRIAIGGARLARILQKAYDEHHEGMSVGVVIGIAVGCSVAGIVVITLIVKKVIASRTIQYAKFIDGAPDLTGEAWSRRPQRTADAVMTETSPTLPIHHPRYGMGRTSNIPPEPAVEMGSARHRLLE